jgi:spore maturation protein CgeB
MVLNINRESMADTGFSPPTRVFEAAGAGACMITDYWEGIENFFEPGREILVARDAVEVVSQLREKSPEQCQRIGSAMRARALQEHTYELRAARVDQILGSVEETQPGPVLGNEYSSRERTAQEFE